MGTMKVAAGLLALGLLAACEGGAPGTTPADPMASNSLAAETEGNDPMEPGAIQDSAGTQIPGE